MSVVSRDKERRSLWNLKGKQYQETISKLIAGWGETSSVNEHGIYINLEAVQIPVPASMQGKVQIELARGADGNWRFGLNYQFPLGGGGFLPSIFDDGYSSRAEAINAGISYLVDRLKSDKFFAKVIPYIEAYQAQLAQVSLF